ncbi:PLDc N-terminal domain-containing protein [Leucobacter tenebrionis]|uniref:PLDc N-terminal domain-containing protein n=1 Tax=Leucobacter tenebrionis TaxID=2873270 RepID=UPI001CA6D9DB|nr:PLDc N-terminal domain-containing protein [Leucobacter tenebrionis]QZY51774.1 PLDc N-terminal domain-containing protein [Leucobacter tenebrionis]
MNPLIPTTFDGVMIVACMFAAGLALIAMVSLFRTSLRPLQFLLWLLLIILVPFAGAIAWFLLRRTEPRSEAA